jgi:hypothetical protein
MWKTVKLADDHSWHESLKNITPADDNSTFLLWDGDLPDTEKDAVDLVDQVILANDGRVSRLVYGEMAPSSTESLACSGNCFCVIAHGSRRCETQYCNAVGLCWWVSCNTSC